MKELLSKSLLLSFFFAGIYQFSIAQGPEVTQWIINSDGSTGYGNIPSNVQGVAYTTNDVFVTATCIPDYDIGPWPGNPNIAQDQDLIFKITRSPTENTGADIATPLGHIGVWKNGVTLFNAKDAASYNNQNIWHQNAIVVEAISFDDCLGHPAPNGEYHLHLNPVCLYDHTDATQHSPLLGYAFDGFPIYGAWAYENADGTGDIIRMKTSYQMRNITDRTTLSDGTILSAPQYGPAINNQYPLGYYTEDFEFIDGLGDLDIHNGRFCVTPDYPDGIYCYFTTIDESYDAEFPYIIGLEYYGTVQAGNTGPNSGNNVIPAEAVVYNPTDVNEQATTGSASIATTHSGWLVNGEATPQWKLLNMEGRIIDEGASKEILHEGLSAGVYIISVQVAGEWLHFRMMK